MTTPALIHLANRAVLRVSGDDRVSFLQGLLSNDVRRVSATTSVWAALLTPQGKYLHDVFVIAEGEALRLDGEAARLDDLRARLSRYRLRAKVAIDPAPELAVFALLGSSAEGFADPRHDNIGRRVIAPKESLAPTAPFETYDYRRLTLGLPDGSRDIEPEKDLLLEARFDDFHGVDFKKGCYVGQEVTARTKYRGLVKKRLLPVRVDGPLPSPGTPVIWEGREVGVLRSGCADAALALLRLDSVAEGRSFTCGQAKLLV